MFCIRGPWWISHITELSMNLSGHDRAPNRHQDLTFTNDLLLPVLIWTNYSQIWIKELSTLVEASKNIICKIAAICSGLGVKEMSNASIKFKKRGQGCFLRLQMVWLYNVCVFAVSVLWGRWWCRWFVLAFFSFHVIKCPNLNEAAHSFV